MDIIELQACFLIENIIAIIWAAPHNSVNYHQEQIS